MYQLGILSLSCSQYSQTICWLGWDDNACLGVRNTSSTGAWPNSLDRRLPWYCIVSPLLQTNKQTYLRHCLWIIIICCFCFSFIYFVLPSASAWWSLWGIDSCRVWYSQDKRQLKHHRRRTSRIWRPKKLYHKGQIISEGNCGILNFPNKKHWKNLTNFCPNI